jgi:fructoselysine 6-kinase
MAVMSAGPRLLGLGDNTMDSYVDAGLQFPGGNAVNVAVLAHRLGVDAGYLGCLGTDAAGGLIREALEGEGIDLARCRQVEGVNARARIVHNAGDRKFIGSIPGVRGRYDLAAEDFAYIAGFDAVHTSIFSELDAELPRLRAASRQLSYDFSERWNDTVFARVLPHIHIAFLSAPNRDDAVVEAVLRHCATSGVMVVATRGAAGSMALVNGEVLRQGIAPATVVDTLGAGDGFIAAFLVALLRGAEPAAALELGAGFAATVCGWQGAFGHGAAWHDSSAT